MWILSPDTSDLNPIKQPQDAPQEAQNHLDIHTELVGNILLCLKPGSESRSVGSFGWATMHQTCSGTTMNHNKIINVILSHLSVVLRFGLIDLIYVFCVLSYPLPVDLSIV